MFITHLIFSKPCSICKAHVYYDLIKRSVMLPLTRADDLTIYMAVEKEDKTIKIFSFINHSVCYTNFPIKKEAQDYSRHLGQLYD